MFNRLFGRTAGAAKDRMTDAESVKIITAYGKALLDRGSSYGDISEPPYAKQRIKDALIIGIKQTRDPKLREQLNGAYIMLAEWQAGFGCRRAVAELTDEELTDPTKAMKRVLDSSGDSLKLHEEVAAEAALLMADLKTQGLA